MQGLKAVEPYSGEIWGESEFYGALKEVARNPRTDWEVGGGLPCEAGGSG